MQLLPPEQELNWLADTLRARWDVKVAMLGPEDHHEQEVKVLNRSIRWTASGIEYEADQRHVQVVIEQLGLDDKSKPVTTPFGPQEQGCRWDQGELLRGVEATKFRAIVARLNYLAWIGQISSKPAKSVRREWPTPVSPTGSF